MSYNSENIFIQKCCKLIENRIDRGGSANWTHYDFEKLSEAILEATGITLSVTTLKRIWGKLPYNNVPATTTLNTLAQYAGFADWRTFEQSSTEKRTVIKRPERSLRWLLWLFPFVSLALVFYLLTGSRSVDTTQYSFSSNKVVTNGVPNSVVFKYNAAGAADSVFIAQSWDVSRKVAVSKKGKEYSAIYYHPGYFRAKLMVGQTVVKEHDLLITSNGWVATIDNDEIPVYIKKDEFQQDSILQVDEPLIRSYNLRLLPQAPKLRFTNVLDLGQLSDDNFTFETTLKSAFKAGNAVCQHVDVLILCKADVIMIPLCAKACIGDIGLYAAGKAVNSANADLSGFGCDLSQWVNLKVSAKEKRIRFFVNDKEAYALTFPDKPTGIVGVQIRFNGLGAVKNTRFVNGNRVTDL